jgi:uncharacterized membrane protein
LLESFKTMTESEIVFLLTTFSNMARARPVQDSGFINAVVREIYEVCICNNTILYVYTILYHTSPYHIPYHTIPYHTIPYHTIPYHTISYHTIPHHTTPYHTIPYSTITTHTMLDHTIPYHTTPHQAYYYVMAIFRSATSTTVLQTFCQKLEKISWAPFANNIRL